MADCALAFVETRADGYHRHVCPTCGLAHLSRQLDPREIRRECGRVPYKMAAPVATAGPPPAAPPRHGPGTELATLFQSWGLTVPCGECKRLLFDMNSWGIAGCRERMPEILDRLAANAKRLKWGEWFAAGTRAALAGYRSLEAIVAAAISAAESKNLSHENGDPAGVSCRAGGGMKSVAAGAAPLGCQSKRINRPH